MTSRVTFSHPAKELGELLARGYLRLMAGKEEETEHLACFPAVATAPKPQNSLDVLPPQSVNGVTTGGEDDGRAS